MSLPTPDQFAEFYQAVHGYEPFPWQNRLAERVCNGDWPHAIALPTAAGKTACIDIAVFALACRANNAARRIFFVVDRRIVVDQAFEHAKKLAKALLDANRGILKHVADSLRAYAEDERPLDVYALRGGMYRESAWIRSPLQPMVIASTVDQVGSRLLFRGYGVSDSMRPIHAGLVGNDSLILLDEAHCARPFDQTMQAVKNYRGWNESHSPFQFVSITATPTTDGEVMRADADDENHPVLGKRIRASKPATLVVAEKAKGKGKKGTDELVKVLEQHARELAKEFACVGVIVNRVKTARDLAKALGEEAVLLTGRMRPLDRDRIFEEKLKPLLSNADGTPPKFVVGTQCLECGADFDFHALVSECASLDALRQRFGRLNRVANRPSAKAVIVIRGDQTEDTTEDPVYGASLAETWKWLKQNAQPDGFDFGVSAVTEMVKRVVLTPLNAPTDDAPVLFPAHLDCWVQTHPTPTPDPDPAIFLHGPKKPGQPDVQVVFRSDLGEKPDLWLEIVALCPPSSSEAVAVPISVFKKWLAGIPVDDQTSDVEGEVVEVDEKEKLEPAARFAVCWRGPEKSESITDPKDVHPNQVYVIPCSSPGANSLGDFITDPPADYAEEAFQKSRDKALLRLKGLVLDEDDEEFETKLSDAIRAKIAQQFPVWSKRVIDSLTDRKRRTVERYPEPLKGYVVSGKQRLGQFDPTYLDDSEPGDSFKGEPVTLDAHSRGVADYAERFAKACGFNELLYHQAGRLHDLGKLDPRFQAMLKQSSPRTAVGPPLAKSARSSRTKKGRDEARLVHQYPSGARHELLSYAIVATQTSDEDLLHLIATHHGSARPFANAVEENDAARPFRVKEFDTDYPTSRQEIATWNAELPDLFWRTVRKHGWWGSAYREAVFRLADHAQSRAEQDGNAKPFTSAAAKIVLPTTVPKPKSYPLPLTGLDGSNPLAFLAALGTFRLCCELFPGASLRWQLTNCWQPVLELPSEMTPDELLAILYSRIHRTVDPDADNRSDHCDKAYRTRKKDTEKALKSVKERKLRGNERDVAIAIEVTPLRIAELAARCKWLESLESSVPASFLSLGKSIAVTAKEFATFALRTYERLQIAGYIGRPDADFTSAFGCEACFDRNERVIPTEFQLITGSGHQYFLETFGTLMQSITIDQLRRSLFNVWTYQDLRLSFRWDPLDDRRYAISWGDPSSSEVRTEHGANLLAAFALPFFPVVPTERGARTTGFVVDSDETFLTWPIWSESYGPDTTRSLFQLDELHSAKSRASLKRRFAIPVIFQVRKIEVGKPPLSKLNLCPAVTV